MTKKLYPGDHVVSEVEVVKAFLPLTEDIL